MRTLTTTLRALALGALLTFGATALAQGPGARNGMDMGPGSAMGPGMPMGPRASDEAGFLAHMVLHHQEAVASARTLLEVTERPELRDLAEAIIASQTAQIEAMEGWLEIWHPDAPRDVPYTPMMRDPGPNDPVEAIERAFLEDMVMHHMMAVRDARMLLMGNRVEHEEVAALARTIVNEQLAEIEQMRTWLADWFGVTMPMGRMLDGAGADTGSDPLWNDMMPGAMGPGTMGPGTMGPGAMMHGGMGTMGGAMGPGMMGHGGMGHGMGHGATGMGMHREHAHHGATDALVGAAEAARLAQAFLDGRGDGAVVGIEEPTITYEVRFEDAEGGGVLIVDARTGTVRLDTER
jgi:uncharacterized protein (DUF305 family)